MSASLLRVENKYCRDWLSGREKGLLVELDIALKNYILTTSPPKTYCLIPLALLKYSI